MSNEIGVTIVTRTNLTHAGEYAVLTVVIDVNPDHTLVLGCWSRHNLDKMKRTIGSELFAIIAETLDPHEV